VEKRAGSIGVVNCIKKGKEKNNGGEKRRYVARAHIENACSKAKNRAVDSPRQDRQRKKKG